MEFAGTFRENEVAGFDLLGPNPCAVWPGVEKSPILGSTRASGQ